MFSISRLLAALPVAIFLALLPPALHAQGSAVVTTEQVRAELVAHAPEGVAAGKPVWLGLKLDHQPHWHTYWKNPGDSGLPTTLQWTLPAGTTAGDIVWPTPTKLPIGPLVNFGFEGTLLLPVPLTIGPEFQAAQLDVKLHAEWLICKDVCIPQSGDFVLQVPAQAATALHGALFSAAQARAPQPASGAQASAAVFGDSLVLKVAGLPAALRGKTLDFFPELAGVIDNAAKAESQWNGADWEARVPLSAQRSESPARMSAVLAVVGSKPRSSVGLNMGSSTGTSTGTSAGTSAGASTGNSTGNSTGASTSDPAGVQLSFDIAGAWPAVAALAPLAAAATVATPALPAAAPISLALALVFALLGGLLLNLMPCVFPVLSLKVIGFATHAHQRSRLLAGGIAYTAGVVLSFVGLAALLLALRAGGEQLGWGFQLQSPGFIAVLAVLFTLIGLNLAGLFEVGSVLPSSVASAQAKHPLVDSFLTGVLAVAIASPCTAPFMGASLGLAFTLPTAQALLVFAFLGLGMALPYLAASAWPALARTLPRPGAWMARFKALMAFPMFATVVWLIWVLGQQVGIDGAAALLGVLVAVAFAAWAFGTPGFSRRARVGFGAAAVTLLASTLVWGWPSWREQPPNTSGAAGAASTSTAVGEWEAWSPARVAELTAQGRPVFVDFTAAWCVTCQFNKRSTLNDATMKAEFESRRVVLLRADWTKRDATISAELARLNRSGVPVYALYGLTPGAPPQLLPEILTVQVVRDALARL